MFFRDIGWGVQAHVNSIHVSAASWSLKSLMAALESPVPAMYGSCMDPTVDMVNIPLFTWFYTSQVVQDF